MLNALDERARGELQRYRRRSLIWLAAGCALFVIFVVSAVIVDNRAQALERTGARVVGIVASVRGLGEQGSLVVEFNWSGRSSKSSRGTATDSEQAGAHQLLTTFGGTLRT